MEAQAQQIRPFGIILEKAVQADLIAERPGLADQIQHHDQRLVQRIQRLQPGGDVGIAILLRRVHPHVQGRQIEAAAAAGNVQPLAHQADQPVFAQRLAEARRRHQRRCARLQLAAQLVDQRHIHARHIGPGQQFLLLALQLFEQFGAHFAALQHVQQVGDGAKEGEGDGGFTQGALAVQLLQQKFDA